ncbi:hypothetical protein RKD52_002439 [Metabacillus sp. SLBN-84]
MMNSSIKQKDSQVGGSYQEEQFHQTEESSG